MLMCNCSLCAAVQALEKAMDRRLPSTLAALYGPHLTCRLALAHTHLLVMIAETILLLPNYTNLPVSVANLYNFRPSTVHSITELSCFSACPRGLVG